jgi:predicted AlkP superfamily phosphohydrolase/phosphomutase
MNDPIFRGIRRPSVHARPNRPCALLPGLLAVLVTALAGIGLVAQPPQGEPRVVILGFDGVDADLTRRWMDEGKLPHLARLREEGTFSPLRSTVPSQTPVSWSTFATGLNPGRHTIFDFLKRDPRTYQPSFAAFSEGTEPFLWGTRTPAVLAAILFLAVALVLFLVLKLFRRKTPLSAVVAGVLGLVAAGAGYWMADEWLPEQRPVVHNNRKGVTFWQYLGDHGKRVRVIRVPVTYPPERYPHGELLSGLGTPDLSLRIGKPFYFTSELFFTPLGGGDSSLEVVELVDNQGEIPTEIVDPPNELFPDGEKFISIPMILTVADDRSSLDIEVSGNRLTLEPGQWSDWVRFTFRFNPLVALHGIGRFRLLELKPEVKLYLSPIQFDPTDLPPTFDITAPPGFVDHLTDRFGLFKTIGWSSDTWSIEEGTLDEKVFLEDTWFTVDKYEEMLLGLLEDEDWDVLVDYFEFTDRIQHVFYRHFDPRHPLYTEAGGAKWGNTILEAYQRMDSIVGEVMERLPEGAVLFVVSDHGFSSFRRGMNYNTWLAVNGYMRLTGENENRENLEDLFDQGDFFANVDWSRTRAYALGLGEIYINLAGREAQGIVQPGEEYDGLLREIREGLESYVDPVTGEHPVAHVWTRDEAYGVYDPDLIPDLIPSNTEGYRVGWRDSLGGIAREIVEDNTRIWSGDHCSVYPPLVEGILFSNRELDVAQAYMGDVMPTLLELYGLEPPTRLDGRSLWPGSHRTAETVAPPGNDGKGVPERSPAG